MGASAMARTPYGYWNTVEASRHVTYGPVRRSCLRDKTVYLLDDGLPN